MPKIVSDDGDTVLVSGGGRLVRMLKSAAQKAIPREPLPPVPPQEPPPAIAAVPPQGLPGATAKEDPSRPWDTWSDAQKAKYEKALAIAEGVKLYRSAGGIGVGAKFAPHSAELEKLGGLTPEQATELARYRMWKQGMKNVPTGPRAPADTPEQIEARRKAYFEATPEERAKIMEESKREIERQHEAYFDSLVKKKAAEETPADPGSV